MKYLSYILIVTVLLFSACSEETFEELNTDPTQLSDVEMRLILPEILTQAAFNKGATPGRMAGIVMQQFEGFDAQQVAYTSYVIGSDAFNNYWRFGMYAGLLRSCQVLNDKAAEEGSTFYSGVAKTLMASEYGLLTSFFGDVPFSEALKGTENLKPKYDTQESVYNGVLSMLDQAISDLGSGTGYAGGDLIYDGDAAKWTAVARALKARYQMHLSKRNGSAASDALSSLSGAFTSLADQPTFQFGTAEIDNWSLGKFGLERPNTLVIANSFAERMDGDPRQSKYMVTDGTTWFYWENANPDLVWGANNAGVPLISYVEVKFLEAEALARTGSDPSAALAAGITASMEQVGLAEADYADYVTANSDVSGLGMEEQVQKIIEEAYKAYYGYNFSEVWSNFRRTGYPAITPDPNGSNGFNPSGGVPKRFPYVVSEAQTNADNLEAARSAQSGALLDVPVWAFQ